MKETRFEEVWPTDVLLNPRSLAHSVIEGVGAELAGIAKSQTKEPSTFLKSVKKYVRLILRPHKDKY